MTLPEKVGQIMQLNGQFELAARIRDFQPGSMLHVVGDAVNQAIDLAARTRLGIPVLLAEDCIHGHSFWKGATIFPTQMALACSWDPALLEQVARITAREVAATGIAWTFSPVLCLTRDLRWGRVGETFGEDPLLIGELGAAMIRGYQGRGLADPDAILATAKHYTGYSETHGGRDASEADLSRRKLRTYFFRAFHRAVQAGAQTFMTGYQSIEGVPSTANRWLLTEVLREEWGYQGIVVTDWDNVGRMHWEQKVVPDLKYAAALAVRAGNDLMMETPGFHAAALQAIEEGLLTEAEIDVPLRRVLLLKFRLGLFENPRRPRLDALPALLNCAEHRAANLESARRSLVLLRNDGLLPLAPAAHRRIAVVGPNADSALAQLGDWTLGSTQYPASYGAQPRELTTTVLDGLRARAPEGVAISHAPGCVRGADLAATIAEAVAAAREAELVVAVVGDTIDYIGEARSTATLELQDGQQELLAALAATGRPLVVVLINSKPLVLPPAALQAAALVEAFNPGMLGGRAVAELLWGDFNPSGKLCVSFPRHVGQQPIFYSQVRGQHGDRYADLTQDPQFPFGHGLAYTAYRYHDLEVLTPTLAPGEAARVRIQITNTGSRAGEEIAQLYIHDEVASVTWVGIELKGFQRVPLAPGETRAVEFTVAYDEFSIVDAAGHRVVEPGVFQILVGPSSRRADLLEARLSVVAAC